MPGPTLDVTTKLAEAMLSALSNAELEIFIAAAQKLVKQKHRKIKIV